MKPEMKEIKDKQHVETLMLIVHSISSIMMRNAIANDREAENQDEMYAYGAVLVVSAVVRFWMCGYNVTVLMSKTEDDKGFFISISTDTALAKCTGRMILNYNELPSDEARKLVDSIYLQGERIGG